MRRPILLPACLLIAGAVIAATIPRALPVGAALSTLAAVWGTRWSPNTHYRAVVRHALVAATAFGYPFFLGGAVLPWLALALHLGIVLAAWTPAGAGRARLLVPQTLAAGLGIALITSATQFFFPSAWRWVALAALGAFLVLLAVGVPTGRIASPTIGAVVLVLAEMLVVLRFLPTHWAINGAVLALVLAIAVEHRRTPRAVFATLLIAVFALGVVP